MMAGSFLVLKSADFGKLCSSKPPKSGYDYSQGRLGVYVLWDIN